MDDIRPRRRDPVPPAQVLEAHEVPPPGNNDTRCAVQPRGASGGLASDCDNSDPTGRDHPCKKGQGRSASPPRNPETLDRLMVP
jgi:hypothetical protein